MMSLIKKRTHSLAVKLAAKSQFQIVFKSTILVWQILPIKLKSKNQQLQKKIKMLFLEQMAKIKDRSEYEENVGVLDDRSSVFFSPDIPHAFECAFSSSLAFLLILKLMPLLERNKVNDFNQKIQCFLAGAFSLSEWVVCFSSPRMVHIFYSFVHHFSRDILVRL